MGVLLQLLLLQLLAAVSAEFTVLTPAHRVIRHTNAQFGFGKGSVGGEVLGSLVFAGEGCTAPADGGAGFVNGAIVMADRGGCAFSTKARVAEARGAAALVVADSKPDEQLTLMRSDGHTAGITIPSVFISQADGAWLRQQLSLQPASGVRVQLGWHVHRKAARVRFELWSTSFDVRVLTRQRKRTAQADPGYDAGGAVHASLLGDFRAIAEALAQHADFAPRFLLIRGRAWGCDLNFNAVHPRCGRQCSNSGRYCMATPAAGSAAAALDSIDVLQEDLRQLCVANWAARAKGRADGGGMAVWWKYVALVNRRCTGGRTGHVSDTSGGGDDAATCSEAAQKTAGADMTAVRRCVVDSGAAAQDGGRNALFEAEIRDAAKEGVTDVPRLTVNGQTYWGDLSIPCPRPLLPSTCGALGFICDGFSQGAARRPAACSDAFWRRRAPGADTGGAGTKTRADLFSELRKEDARVSKALGEGGSAAAGGRAAPPPPLPSRRAFIARMRGEEATAAAPAGAARAAAPPTADSPQAARTKMLARWQKARGNAEVNKLLAQKRAQEARYAALPTLERLRREEQDRRSAVAAAAAAAQPSAPPRDSVRELAKRRADQLAAWKREHAAKPQGSASASFVLPKNPPAHAPPRLAPHIMLSVGGRAVSCRDEVAECRAASRTRWRDGATAATHDPCAEAKNPRGSAAARWWATNCRATCGLCE
jgi:hypothetical protein